MVPRPPVLEPGALPRVLFISSGSDDYVADSLMHGLREVLGARAVDWPRVDQLYVTEPPEHRARRYGRAFTLYGGLLADIQVDRTWITARIAGGEFDIVVVGDFPRRAGSLIELLRVFPPNAKLAVIDGADAQKIDQVAPRSLLGTGGMVAPRALRHADVYFKREITPLTARSRALGLLPASLAWKLIGSRGLTPIAISIPASAVVDTVDGPRDQQFQSHIVDPEVAERSGGTVAKPFTSQDEYYADLRRSRFGITTRREGWDALRHYEIAAAGAIPCFRGLREKPEVCAPHGLVDGVNCLAYDSADELFTRIASLSADAEQALRRGTLAWARDHTTAAEARRFLDRLGWPVAA